MGFKKERLNGITMSLQEEKGQEKRVCLLKA
jgi:hypothetical protein